MRLEELEYHAPASLAEASVLMNKLGAHARIVGGGTDVLEDVAADRQLVVTQARAPRSAEARPAAERTSD